MSFSDRLKEARNKAGRTQKQLADELKVTPAMIAQYETGKRKPKQDTLSKIAEALHLSYGYAPNGEPYFYCFVDTVQHGDENEKFNEYQYKDAMASNSDGEPSNPIAKPEPAIATIAAHFDGDEYTEEELEQIQKFAEFVKSQRKDTE
ncbi:helix-turn-helix domain-containing protein [Merdimonas faecis]